MAPAFNQPSHRPSVAFADLSDEDSSLGSIQHDSILSTTASSPSTAHGGNRNEYSDDDINILYEIVVKAEEILEEELSPSSRLPTHALFKAYDEVLPKYGLDPDEDQHISKLVFMVGGVKNERLIIDKFKTVMARMNITLAIDVPSAPVSEVEDDAKSRSSSDDYSEPPEPKRDVIHHIKPDIYDLDAYTGLVTASDIYEDEMNQYDASISREQHLASSAEAFRRRHHAKFSAVNTIRHWQKKSNYISNICDQLDAARQADLEDDAEDRFYIWRAVAAEAEQIAPEDLPSNIYSKRTERIAVRTYEILSTKKALKQWRAASKAKLKEAKEAQPLPADPLARLADRAHNNLLMSRAFAQWSNRAEEESEKAQMAVKAYEMSLKAKALGFHHRPTADSLIGKARDSNPDDVAHNLASTNPHASAEAQPDEDEEVDEEKEAMMAQLAAKAYETNLKARALGIRPRLNAETLIGDSRENAAAADFPNQPDTGPKNVESDIEKQPRVAQMATQTDGTGSEAKALAIRTRVTIDSSGNSNASKNTTTTPLKKRQKSALSVTFADSAHSTSTGNDSGANASTKSSTGESPASAGQPSGSTDDDDDDEDVMDERTLLARRHILRMRFFEAWESYTAERLSKVEEFKVEQQNQRLAQTIPVWRDKATSQKHQILALNAERANFYMRTTKVLPIWRERAQQSVEYEEEVLEHYAERADYYNKTTRTLPILRRKAQQAKEREQLLEHYANRASYFYRVTEALPVWRDKAAEAAEMQQELACYSERADYYYKTHDTLLEWRNIAKQRRKERLKEAHLETRRIVKKGMGERCINQWREKLQPSLDRTEIMDACLEDAIANREAKQSWQALHTWRSRAQEKKEIAWTREAIIKANTLEQWREKSALCQEVRIEADERREERAKSRALKIWNSSSIQNANRPDMVANALVKKERRLLRQGFEGWYSRTADKLVPVELPDGNYKSVDQVVEDAQRQSSENQVRGLFHAWKAAAKNKNKHVVEETYAPTPGRPHLFLGPLGRRETTTPLAPVPSRGPWQPRDSILGGSEMAGRASRSGRPKRNLRVSWAA
ncbi:Sfi1 spindle body protein-domain-containing protein [Biscogniauxia mediterranea]|nr:Sfi1 spindle body protein-domain-containing protein [Biscogniauxia mediterranea]